MQSHELLKPLRDEYSECCLTNDYQENHCRIALTGLDPSTLVTIDGDQNQQCSKHRQPGRLCDRLIFGYLGKEFICAAEIKGGKNPEVPKAVHQIQGGLDLAREMLSNRTQGD